MMQRIHVPLVMSWPSILPEGETVTDFVEISDILPTIFEAIAQQAPRPLRACR